MTAVVYWYARSIGGQFVGTMRNLVDIVELVVDGGDGCLRRAAAGVATAAVVNEGLFTVEGMFAFTFNTYSDSAEGLRDYVATHWRDGRIADETVERMRQAAARAGAARPHISERVYVARLRPLPR